MSPAVSLPDLVRESCARVCRTADLVVLNPDRLALIGASLVSSTERGNPLHISDATTGGQAATHDGGPKPDGSKMGGAKMMERSCLLVFALDSINFGSGYHDIVDKRSGLSGARSMEANLREFEGHSGPLTPNILRTLSASRCATVFRQELEGSPHAEAKAELMALFSTALGSLANWLDTYDGRALHAVEAAGGSAVSLATMLLAMPFYRDQAIYTDRGQPAPHHQPTPDPSNTASTSTASTNTASTNTASTNTASTNTVHFYKRAQITPADLQRELKQPVFHDLHKLTAFADNLVPHVLRIDGAIILERGLEDQINKGTLLPAGSDAEIEIRAAGIEAVRLLAQLTGRTEMELDLMLWTQGRQPQYKRVPRHRCRTVFY